MDVLTNVHELLPPSNCWEHFEVWALSSLSNDGSVLVYRPQGEHCNSQHVLLNSTRNVRVSVFCWGCISHEETGILCCMEFNWMAFSISTSKVIQCAVCKSALTWWNNPVWTKPLLCSWFSCGAGMVVMAGWCQTHWLATISEPYQEYVEWGEKSLEQKLAWTPSEIYIYIYIYTLFGYLGCSCLVSELYSVCILNLTSVLIFCK